jgi:hypothetical protein
MAASASTTAKANYYFRQQLHQGPRRRLRTTRLALRLVDHARGEGVAEPDAVRQPLHGLRRLPPAPGGPLGGVLLLPAIGDAPLAMRPLEDIVRAEACLPGVPLHQARQEHLLRLSHHHGRLQELQLGTLQLLHYFVGRVHPQLQCDGQSSDEGAEYERHASVVCRSQSEGEAEADFLPPPVAWNRKKSYLDFF